MKPVLSTYDKIPGLTEAFREEARVRNAAFFGQPPPVAGITVRHLTLRDYQRLMEVGSPFLVGGIPNRGDIAYLLWHQRTNESPTDDLTRAEFVQAFDALPLPDLSDEVGGFISDALMDAPQKGFKAGGEFVGMAASLIHRFRIAYPATTHEQVLDMPLGQLWQFLRLIQLDAGATLFNRYSDRAKGDWLRSLSTVLLSQPAPGESPP